MKLTFKDLKQQKFVIEAEPSETIAEVKAKISSEKGWEPNSQKLIYSGKILQDDKTVEFYSIEEKGFIVCMITKPKIPAASTTKAAPSTPAPKAIQTPTAPAPVTSTTNDTPATPSPAPAASRSSDVTGLDGPSALVTGPEAEAMKANIMAVADCDYVHADNAFVVGEANPTRSAHVALDYDKPTLQTMADEKRARDGRPTQTASSTSNNPVPSATSPPPTSTGAAATTGGDQPINLFEAAAQAGQGRSDSGARGEAGDGSAVAAAATGGSQANLDFLRNNPQFQQLRQVVQQQPQMLEPILQQVGAGNPQLAQLISEHPEQFLQLLSEDADDDAALPQGAQAVSVTPEERDAIQRLCALGFAQDDVIQAYFACDKNEELAANFLFEQPEDPEDQ